MPEPDKTPNLRPDLLALYRKKSLDWRAGARTLHLDLPVDVFSSFQVDRGTRALLRAVAAAGDKYPFAMDLGCGYGPIGLFLSAAEIAEKIDALDRDALAVAFCRHNAAVNGLDQVAARAAIAYEAPKPGAVDAVLTNLPAKAGPAVHRLILLGADSVLRPGGDVWLVVVSTLAGRIDEILADPAVEVLQRTPRGEHTVYRYRFRHRPEVPQAPYLRDKSTFTWKGEAYTVTALHGLREFDTRSWVTDLVLDVFRQQARRRGVRHLVACHPQQGHAPLLARRLAPSVEEITLISRDRIALRASRANLEADGFTGPIHGVHSADFQLAGGPRGDAAIAVLNEKEGLAVNAAKLEALLSGAVDAAVVGCKSSFAARLVRELRDRGLRSSAPRKRKALSAFCVRG